MYKRQIIAHGMATYDDPGNSGSGALSEAAAIRFRQDGNPTYSYVPGRIEFWTGTVADTVMEQVMVMDSSQFVGIGTTSPGCYQLCRL